jgi:hypothetical protein
MYENVIVLLVCFVVAYFERVDKDIIDEQDVETAVFIKRRRMV